MNHKCSLYIVNRTPYHHSLSNLKRLKFLINSILNILLPYNYYSQLDIYFQMLSEFCNFNFSLRSEQYYLKIVFPLLPLFCLGHLQTLQDKELPCLIHQLSNNGPG
jgi:hypothetical protein